MNELISIRNENGELLVDARELHEKLILSEGKGTEFAKWFKRMCEYGFEENIDYVIVKNDEKSNGRPKVDYALKIDMTKEICMIQRNDKGKQFRKYFIECEKKLKQTLQQPQLPTTYKEALQQLLIQVEENEKLQVEVEQKQIIIDNVINDNGLFGVNVVGKTLKPYCDEMGSRKIFSFLRDKRVLMDCEGTQKHNLPYDRYNKYFEIKTVVKGNCWGANSYYKTYFNGKGLKWFLNKLVKEGYMTQTQVDKVKDKF